MMENVISCVVVTPQTLVSYGIMALLDEVLDMEVVGVTKSLAELEDIAHRTPFDVIILDPHALDSSTDQTLHILEDLSGDRPHILVIKDIDDTSPASKAPLPYASGCFSLRDPASVIVTAIRVAHTGLPGQCPCITGENEDEPVLCNPRQLHSLLSPRELEVFLLISDNVSVKEIAERLKVSLSSVNVYRSRIMRKMQLTSNLAFIRYALQYRLLD